MALGLLEDSEGGEGYLDNNGKVSGYRYSDEKGAEIIVDTFVQTVTVSGALIDEPWHHQRHVPRRQKV